MALQAQFILLQFGRKPISGMVKTAKFCSFLQFMVCNSGLNYFTKDEPEFDILNLNCRGRYTKTDFHAVMEAAKAELINSVRKDE